MASVAGSPTVSRLADRFMPWCSTGGFGVCSARAVALTVSTVGSSGSSFDRLRCDVWDVL